MNLDPGHEVISEMDGQPEEDQNVFACDGLVKGKHSVVCYRDPLHIPAKNSRLRVSLRVCSSAEGIIKLSSCS